MSLSILPGLLLIELLFLLLTAAALVVSERVKRGPRRPDLIGSFLPPIGSLYALTTAFLLSNVIFQVSNLKTALTQEVVTLGKLSAVVSVLPPDQRLEARRLIMDYADLVSREEAHTLTQGKPGEETATALNRLSDFFGSIDSVPAKDAVRTPETTAYFRKASDFLFDLIDARERRLSLALQSLPSSLWLAIYAMYGAMALTAFLVHPSASANGWVALILAITAPIPPVLLFVYSNPLLAGLVDIPAAFMGLLSRNL